MSTPVEAGVVIQFHGGLGKGGDGSSLLFPGLRDSFYICTTTVVVSIRITRKHPVLDVNLWRLLLLLQGGVLQGGLEVLHQRGEFLLDGHPVDPENDEEEGGGDDDEDAEECAGDGGVTAVLLVLARRALQEHDVLNPDAGIVLGEPVVAPHLSLVDNPGRGVGQPVEHPVHLAVAAEGISVQINLTVVVAASAGVGTRREHLVNLLSRVRLQIPDLIEADIQVSESLQTVEGEVDLSKLIVRQVDVQQVGKVAEHVVIPDLPDLVLLQMKFLQFCKLGTEEDILQVFQIPLGVHLLGEGVGQMELGEVVEV